MNIVGEASAGLPQLYRSIEAQDRLLQELSFDAFCSRYSRPRLQAAFITRSE